MLHKDDVKTQAADRAFVSRALSAPYLDAQEEAALARRWRDHGDQRALHRLVEAHTRLAQAVARRFRHYGLPMSDLIQEANIGLLEGAQRYDPERGVRFSTYAAWWIRAAVQDYVLRNWSIVRTGTTSAQKALFFNFRRLRAEAEAQAQGPLTDAGRETIATKLGVRVADVSAMEARLSANDRSLDAAFVGEEGPGRTWGDMLADERATPEEEALERGAARARSACLAQAMDKLPAREQEIVRARHLAEEGHALTLEALGARLGISKERVRQLEAKALEKLTQFVRTCAGGRGVQAAAA
ncbi:MAG TPA: RNA polymerase factor sigma-32 [Rhodospirillaceae bacterium]|nr:RNA polymerase factor sigma-32 [Alphaproteobacteria bacterium]HBH25982.1 RNA polymerase factor sigma-32 [Rhodospirillaceae bacterium]